MNLSIRYQHRTYWIDDYGVKGVILHNEHPNVIRRLWVKYKYSEHCLVETVKETLDRPKNPNDWKYIRFADTVYITEQPKLPEGHKIEWEKYEAEREVYKINIIEFVKRALVKGYDWKLYGEPEWEAIQPKKRKKFLKPRFKRRRK